MSEESIKTPATSNNSFTSKLAHIQNITTGLKFEGGCLIHDKVSFAHRNVVNLFIVYKLDTSSRYINTHSTLGPGLFGSAKLSKIKYSQRKIVVMVLDLIHVSFIHCQNLILVKILLFSL